MTEGEYVPSEAEVKAAARALCPMPDVCVMGSGSITYDGKFTMDCREYAWQRQLGPARSALMAAAKARAEQGWGDA